MTKPPAQVQKTKFSLDDEDNEPISVNTILASSQKLLAINKGLTEPDDRDALWNKRILMPNKQFAERVVLDAGGHLRNAVYKASRKRNLTGLVPGTLGEGMNGVLIGSPLSSPLEEINPMAVVEQAQRISHMGEGGLSSSTMISSEAQAVHPSIFGILDVLAGPESEKAGVDIRTAVGTRVGSDGRLYQQFRNKRTGQIEWVSPDTLSGKNLKIPD